MSSRRTPLDTTIRVSCDCHNRGCAAVFLFFDLCRFGSVGFCWFRRGAVMGFDLCAVLSRVFLYVNGLRAGTATALSGSPGTLGGIDRNAERPKRDDERERNDEASEAHRFPQRLGT